jgi:hypothetical protein
MPKRNRWLRVVFAAECDEAGNCPICKTIDFAECRHPGPTQEDEYEYRERNGVLEARRLATEGDSP